MNNLLKVALTIKADTDQAKASINALNNAVGKSKSAASGAAQGLGNLANAADKASSSFGKARRGVESISATLSRWQAGALGVMGVRFARQAIDIADAYGQMASRIKMATSSADEYEAVQMRLLDVANETYRPLTEAQEGYIRTADALRAMGYNTQQAIDVAGSLSYLFVTNAASAERAANAQNAFAKAIQTGKVNAEGWQSILAAVPTIVDAIAASSGKTADEVRKLGATGKLTAAELTEGLRSSYEANRKLAADMPVTVADAMTKLSNSVSVLLGELNSGTGLSQLFVAAIDGISSAVDALTEDVIEVSAAFTDWIDDIKKLPESARAVFGDIAQMLDALVGVVGADTQQIDAHGKNAFVSWSAYARREVQLITIELAHLVNQAGNVARAIKQYMSGNYGSIAEARAGLTQSMTASLNVRRQMIADTRTEAEARIKNANALKAESIERRKALQAQVEEQRKAPVKLRSASAPKSSGGRGGGQDTTERAYLQQMQTLTVSLAEAEQRLANARAGNDEKAAQAVNRLEVWIKTAKEAQRLSAGQIDALRRQAVAVDAATAAYTKLVEAKKREKAIREGMAGVNIEIMRLSGDASGAAREEFKRQYRDLVENLNKEIAAGNLGARVQLDAVIRLQNLKEAQVALDGVVKRIDKLRDRQGQEEQSIQTGVETGLYTQIEGQERLLNLHREIGAELEKQRPLLEQLAAMPGLVGEQASAALAALNNQTQRLSSTMTLFESTVKNSIKEGLSNAIQGLADGTMTLREAIHELASTVAQSLLKMYAESAVQYFMKGDLFKGVFDAAAQGSGGAGGLLGALFGQGSGADTGMTAGAAAVTSSATVLAAAGNTLVVGAAAIETAAGALAAANGASSAAGGVGALLGFSGGGYTGSGGKYDVAGLVHGGEFVNRREVVSQPGALAFLTQFNRHGMEALRIWAGLPGYAHGGPVPPIVDSPMRRMAASFTPATPAVAQSTTLDNRQTFNLIDDPERIAGVLRGEHGEQAITVLLSRNPGKFRQVLGL